ncbi:MAG: phosphoadenylyl-sulfate reductase [Gammaproteobacteria bacterium]|nr:MAG: phosphoadenylyl-sulfate reductase [Gammaproteobacteria bacterium]
MNDSLISLIDIEEKLRSESPQKIIKYALSQFENIAISFSGAEDVALIEIAKNYRSDISVFCLDTGRLHPETYRFIEKVRKHYGIKIDVISPNGDAIRQLVTEKGLFSFYEDDHKECCGIRKIEPLRRKLSEVDAWITGQRKDQSPTRAEIPVIQDDKIFARPNSSLTKFNPLANWSSKEVWDYIRMCEAPYNELHDKGYISIGCEPCTRPVGPNEHERAGRWWWEEATKKECGLHSGNVE